MCAIPLALLSLTVSGCTAGTGLFYAEDPTSRHEPGSDQWWAEKGALQPGVRQKYSKGKMWPARARSTAPKQQFSHIYHSQHYWPLPYTCQDREAVFTLMDTQTALGWQEETTLFNHHFETDTQLLNQAGLRHLEYILFTVPQSRRNVFIQSTHDEVHDVVRTTSVEDAIAGYQASGESISVSVRRCRESGRPAAEVQAISDLYRESIPAPRLGSAGSNGAGNGGVAGGGGVGSGGGGSAGSGGGAGGMGSRN
jgi:uncharacterized membrane protein YgcG